MKDSKLEKVFPNLQRTPYACTSPFDRRYNCIAWAAGFVDRWMWPTGQDCYWPEGVPQSEEVSAFVALYAACGYTPCDDGELEEGLEKVAVFARNGIPTHAARQLPSGMWTSKCGKDKDISHTLLGLSDSPYGQPVAYLARLRTAGQPESES